MKRRTDGRWQKKVTLPNGKSKILYSSASNEKLAVKDFNEQLMCLKLKEKEKLLFKNVADEWNDEYRSRITDINYNKNTRFKYEAIVNHFGEYDIHDITPTIIHQYINKLIKQQYSHKTIASYKSILNMIFSYAIFNGITENNPTQIITLPSNLPKKERKLPTDEELQMINSNYTEFDFLPYFLLNTGLRKSEALALEYSDIDKVNKTITINKHLIHDGNKPIIEHKTKTKNSKRTVILLDRVADKLPDGKNGLVFGNSDGTPLTKCQFAKRWLKWQKTHNTNITAHQLRHGFATMLYEAGIDLKDAQDLMGHSDITTTQNIYTHIRNKRKEQTAQKLNDFNF